MVIWIQSFSRIQSCSLLVMLMVDVIFDTANYLYQFAISQLCGLMQQETLRK